MLKKILTVVAIAFLLPSLSLATEDNEEILDLINQKTAPDGVVFEIVSGDPDWLKVAIPQVKNYIVKLRKRFPKLQVAVVTHGEEQFALTTDNQEQYKQLHKEVRSLTQDADIPVHICGTYARWKNVSPEEFPDYVDVSATGPAEIRQYEDFGYKKIVISD